jgi:hypothetical protein
MSISVRLRVAVALVLLVVVVAVGCLVIVTLEPASVPSSIAAGNNTVQATIAQVHRAPLDVSSRTVVPTARGLSTNAVDAVLGRLLILITADSSEECVSGIAVSVVSRNGVVVSSVTNDDGALRCDDIADGFYVVETILGSGSVRVSGGGEYTVRIEAHDLCWVDGRVVDELGGPVPGALVIASCDDSGHNVQQVATSDANGCYRVRCARPGFAILARCEGFLDGMIQVAGDGVDLSRGVREARCAIAVVDERGVGAPAEIFIGRPMVIRVRNPVTRSSERWPFGRVFVTGEVGRVTVGALGDYTRDIAVIPKDKRLARWNGQWDGGAEQVIMVSPACNVSVRVLAPDGAPAVGATVTTMDQRVWRRPRAITDELGYCVLNGLAGGQLILKAVHPKLGRDDITVMLRPGEQWDCTFVLGAECRVRVVRDGVAVANQLVKVTSGGSEMITNTNGEGEAAVPTSWFSDAIVWSMSSSGAWKETKLLTAGRNLMVVSAGH